MRCSSSVAVAVAADLVAAAVAAPVAVAVATNLVAVADLWHLNTRCCCCKPSNHVSTRSRFPF